MRKLLSSVCLFVLAAILHGCMCCDGPPCDEFGIGRWTKKIDSPEIVHAIQHYLAYLRHEKHLRLEDASIWYNEEVNSVRLEFISQDILELREARFLLVDVVEGLLAELNKNPVIAPELITFPLRPEFLEIYINFESFHGEFVDPYYVGWMKLENGEAYYYAFDIKTPNRNKWDFRIEPYSKSREFTVFEREAEKLFQESIELERPHTLRKDQYVPLQDKKIPRYFSPYHEDTIFDY